MKYYRCIVCWQYDKTCRHVDDNGNIIGDYTTFTPQTGAEKGEPQMRYVMVRRGPGWWIRYHPDEAQGPPEDPQPNFNPPTILPNPSGPSTPSSPRLAPTLTTAIRSNLHGLAALNLATTLHSTASVVGARVHPVTLAPPNRATHRSEAVMASPGEANGISTPPANTQNTALGNPSPPTTQTSTVADQAPPSATNGALPSEPATSFKDDGLSTKRPRDARLIHLLLAAQGVQSYQERVPLMIMDFAYRYTSGILSDAMALTADGYGMPPSGRSAEGTVNLNSLRLSIGSRQHYQFQPTLPKEVLLEMAQEKNRVALPKPDREFGIRLPPERYTLTGTGFGLKEEWDSEEEVDEGAADQVMGDVEGGTAEQEEVDQEEFEDAMGGDSAMADA